MFRRCPEHLIIVLFFNWILIDSVLKWLLYGPRIRINYCSPGNIGNLRLIQGFPLPQASLLIVQGQFRRFFNKFHIKVRFWQMFDYNIIWKLVLRYWLDETDRSVGSGVSNFRNNGVHVDVGQSILTLDN